MVGAEVAHGDGARCAVDADDVGVGMDLDVEPLAEHLRRRHQQRALVGDDVADVVGQSAVGEGHVGPAIEDRDLHRLVEAAQPRGTRRAAGDAADDQTRGGAGRFVLLLVVNPDVVDGLSVGVDALGRNGHRLSIVRYDVDGGENDLCRPSCGWPRTCGQSMRFHAVVS